MMSLTIILTALALFEIDAVLGLEKRLSVYGLNSQIAELRSELHQLKTRVYRRLYKGTGSGTVAFTAYMSGTGRTIYYKGQILRYTHVLNNIGNGYDKRRGSFRCPSSGTYVFFFTSMPERGMSHSIWLTLNGKFIAEAVSGKVEKGYNMGSNMVILRLKKGDRVWIRASKKWKLNSAIRFRYAGNTFSGFKLS
ncbi:C1q-related factor-like [Saccostrea cucullata]|uniref:C1q-related factor-like n=1 Tax=Saccostrea cuccullata TaxID=36930 RepID=UPI002ED6B947